MLLGFGLLQCVGGPSPRAQHNTCCVAQPLHPMYMQCSLIAKLHVIKAAICPILHLLLWFQPCRLNIRFTERYPLEPPEVTFLTPTPIHPHIYSNGHICLDILYDGQNGGWSPALTISKLCLSLRSMLASNTDKVRMQLKQYSRL